MLRYKPLSCASDTFVPSWGGSGTLPKTPLDLSVAYFSDDGVYSTLTLESDLDQGQVFQGAESQNRWFGAELLGPGYVLVGCSLAPGWDKSDTVTPAVERIEALEKAFPE